MREERWQGVESHLSDAGPVVWPGLVSPHSHVYHGLYSEAVASLHHTDSLVLGIMGNVGGTVEQPASVKLSNISWYWTLLFLLVNAVPTVRSDHRVACTSRVFLDDITHVSVLGAGLHCLYSFLQTLPGIRHQISGRV